MVRIYHAVGENSGQVEQGQSAWVSGERFWESLEAQLRRDAY